VVEYLLSCARPWVQSLALSPTKKEERKKRKRGKKKVRERHKKRERKREGKGGRERQREEREKNLPEAEGPICLKCSNTHILYSSAQ
jgi:hypothetical protein